MVHFQASGYCQARLLVLVRVKNINFGQICPEESVREHIASLFPAKVREAFFPSVYTILSTL